MTFWLYIRGIESVEEYWLGEYCHDNERYHSCQEAGFFEDGRTRPAQHQPRHARARKVWIHNPSEGLGKSDGGRWCSIRDGIFSCEGIFLYSRTFKILYSPPCFVIPRTWSARSGPQSFSVSGPTFWNNCHSLLKRPRHLTLGRSRKSWKQFLFSIISNTVWLGNICLFMNCTGAFVTVMP